MVNASENKKKVEIAPGIIINFVRIPAGKFVLGNNKQGQNNNAPQSEVEISKPFWMAETELTNEQYNVIFQNMIAGILLSSGKIMFNPVTRLIVLSNLLFVFPGMRQWNIVTN